MQTLPLFISTVPFIQTHNQALPLYINTYDAVGNTISKVTMNINYVPQVLVGFFSFMEPSLYAGLPQWYSVSFINSLAAVSTYPFIRISTDSNIQFSTPLQCNSTTLLPFNASGILFSQESSSSITISNILQLTPAATYQIVCRMQTVSTKFTSSISPAINI